MTNFAQFKDWSSGKSVYINPDRVAYVVDDSVHTGNRIKIAFSEASRDFLYVQCSLEEAIRQLGMLTLPEA